MTARHGTRRAWLAAAVCFAAIVGATPAAAVNGIPNTDPTSTTSLLASGPVLRTLFATPAGGASSLTATDCAAGGTQAGVKQAAGPEEDLAATLDRLAAAGNPPDAQAEFQRAKNLLQGGTVVDLVGGGNTVYSGMPLLGVNPAGSIKSPSGNTFTVRVARFGEHVATDTSLLNLSGLSQTAGFRVKYCIVELGATAGGTHTPTPLVSQGGAPVGGLNSISLPLGLPETNIGTTEGSRFITAMGLLNQTEHTRLGVREVTVNMPPPANLSVLLDPNLREGHEGVAAIRPSTPDRIAKQGAITIASLSNKAPEKQIHTALGALNVADWDTEPFRAAVRNARALVGSMRTKGKLPPGVVPGPADLTVAFVNNEVYTSAKTLHAPPGDPITVHVVNEDGFTHDLEMLDLSGRSNDFGPLAWGKFGWQRLVSGESLAAGASRTLTLAAAGSSFALWVGDPNSGPHAGGYVQVDRGPRIEGFRAFGNSFDMPLHGAFDQNGHIWLTLPGSDSFGRLIPAAKLANSTFERFPIPGGIHNGQAPEGLMIPIDIAVDAYGVAWATLAAGNAIARIDPKAVTPGTGNGIRIYKLPPCPNPDICRPPPPPAPIIALSREPTQLSLHQDGQGNTVIWFTEPAADNIGVLRVRPDGTPVSSDGTPVPDDKGAIDLACDCQVPLGIDVDAAGNVWFTEAVGNRIGRLRPDQARPFSTATPTIDHFPIPNPITIVDAELLIRVQPDGTRVAVPVNTVVPHSLHVDPKGRVWWTEQGANRIGTLDPAQVQPGQSTGMAQFTIPDQPFGGLPQPADLTSDRAGRVYVADEYGDEIVTATAEGGVSGPKFRPLERQSLTDKPMPDHLNNLYWIEAGAGILARARGVTAGVPLPGPPATWTADTKANQVRGEGVTEMSSVEVRVERPGRGIVATALGVPVSGGAFTVGAGGTPWTTSPFDPVRQGDTVTIVPGGTNAPGAFSFFTATLTTNVSGTTVTGTAKNADRPVFGVVRIDANTGSTAGAIQPLTGGFAASLPRAPNPAAGTTSWSYGRPVGIVRTVASFLPEPPDPDVVPAVSQATACQRRIWAVKTGARWKVTLFNLTLAGVRKCAGKPTSVKKRGKTQVVRYRKDLVVTLVKGRVKTVKVLTKRYTSSPAGLQVGARTARLPVRRAKVKGGVRAALRLGSGFANLRLTTKGARITSITATKVAKLDKVGQRLARAGR